MDIRLARSMGFCFGVKRAVNTVRRVARERGGVNSLGHLVHNEQVVRGLEGDGVRVVKELDDIGSGPVAISAHGVGPTTYEAARQRGLEVIDATCPIVRQIQQKAQQLARDGFLVIVFGDRNHSEVRGVVGWTDDRAFVVGAGEDLVNLPAAHKVAVLAQSTLAQSTFNALLGQLITARMDRIHELVVHNTLCNATTSAQAAALELAKDVGVLVVVGGRGSANTRHLAELCAATGVPTYQVEQAAELNREWFVPELPVGVTAGASTPDWVVAEVVERIAAFGQR